MCKSMPPHTFMCKLIWDKKCACSGRDPDDTKYRKGNNETSNINVQDCSLYAY